MALNPSRNMILLDRHTIQSAMLIPPHQLLEESDQPAIVLNLQSLTRLNPSLLRDVVAWCRRLPCPVIGLGDMHLSSSPCADAIVDGDSDLNLILRRIQANPQAASVLVQVLRTIENLSFENGLVVESLAYATLQSGQEFTRWLAQHQKKELPELTEDAGPAVLANRQGDLLTLTLNRPQTDNAYSVEMRDGLMEKLQLVSLDDSIQHVYVNALGRCFCTGGELSEFGLVASPLAGHLIRSQLSPARLVLAAASRYHFHVHKACVGSGLEIPACAGRLTASPRTLFWLPELTMGLIPGAGGCVSISRRIGRQRTAYMVLMNKKIDANRALEWGLIDEILDQ